MSYIISDNPMRFSRFQPRIIGGRLPKVTPLKPTSLASKFRAIRENTATISASPRYELQKGIPAMATLLCVGADDAAMATRKLILTRAGHDVRQARDLREVKAECEATSFSVVVIGHSLNPNEKMRVCSVIREHCKNAKLLELHTGISPQLREADAHLYIGENHPHELVDGVAKLALL